MVLYRLMRFLKLWGAVAAWCGGIFFFSSIPDFGGVDTLGGFIRAKCAHLAEYAVLSWFFRRAFRESTTYSLESSAVAACLFSVLYAISDEYHQSFVFGRHASVYDVFLDGFGAVLGVLFRYNWFFRLLRP